MFSQAVQAEPATSQNTSLPALCQLSQFGLARTEDRPYAEPASETLNRAEHLRLVRAGRWQRPTWMMQHARTPLSWFGGERQADSTDTHALGHWEPLGR